MFAYLEFTYILFFVILFVNFLLLLLSYSSQNSMFAKWEAQNKRIIILEFFLK